MLYTRLSLTTPSRAWSTAGSGAVRSKPMTSIPMLLLSWTVLCVMRKLVTFPFTTSDSLEPVFRVMHLIAIDDQVGDGGLGVGTVHCDADSVAATAGGVTTGKS